MPIPEILWSVPRYWQYRFNAGTLRILAILGLCTRTGRGRARPHIAKFAECPREQKLKDEFELQVLGPKNGKNDRFFADLPIRTT